MSKFDDFYSKKPISELLEKFRIGKISPESIDREWYEALLLHLQKRDMTSEQKNEFDRIVYSDLETLKATLKDSQSLQMEHAKTESNFAVNNHQESNYNALKTVTKIISILGKVMIIIGFGLFLFLIGQDQGLIGFISLVISFLISLLFLAFSNLIQVFIDIERNTRNTNEAFKKLNEK